MSTSDNTLNIMPEIVERVCKQYSKPTKEYASVELEYGGEVILEYEEAVQFMKIMQKAFVLKRSFGDNPISIKEGFKVNFNKIPAELVALIRFGSNMQLSMQQIEDIYEQSKITTAKALFSEESFNSVSTSQS